MKSEKKGGTKNEALGMIKRGSCAQGDSPTNTQIYWKRKEGGASLKSHGMLGPIPAQWLHGQMCIIKIRPNKIRSCNADWEGKV